jgi:hypothetical protein
VLQGFYRDVTSCSYSCRPVSTLPIHTAAFQRCYKGLTRCYKMSQGVTRCHKVLQGCMKCYRNVTEVLQWCYRDVSSCSYSCRPVAMLPIHTVSNSACEGV